MAGNNAEHRLPSRPPLHSHQSNSVPSTPHQHAKDFRTRSRSPSPHVGLGGHSPRSVVSEAAAPMTTLPKGRPTCKYETSAAFSRRRMQYDIGTDPLGDPKEEPKKALDPDEEKKLSGDMRELYDRLLPSAESETRRTRLVEKLGNILRKEWPNQDFTVHVFGSSGNMLCTSESDVDICIQTPMKQLESMHILAEALANNGMERVICVAAAKVPIVKVWDPELRLAADLNVNNTLALENTRMIKTYVLIDERVRPLAMIIKHWTKQRILNDAGIGGTLSSYSWICMILNFLQTRKPPILPALHQKAHKPYIANDGTESGFSDDIAAVREFGQKNKETVGELLFHFFRKYAYEIRYDREVISVRHGRSLSRDEKRWDHASKEGQWRLCVEEPFNITRNLGNSADDTAFRGIHLELRRAFDLLADGGQLEKCCEQYQFPPEEKTFFKKPSGGAKAILSAPGNSGMSGRNRQNAGGSVRGGRANLSGKTTSAAYRRSSSGAAYGRMTGIAGQLPYMPGQIMPPTPEVQYMYMNQAPDLAQDFMYMRYAAAMQARNAATAHANAVIQGSGSSRDPCTTASPQKTPYLSRSPQLDANATPGFDSSRTNPSSPSMSTSVPARRGLQRTSVSSGSQPGAVRSQSQPARGISNLAYPILPYAFDAAGRPVFANMLPQDMLQNPPLRYTPGYPTGTLTTDSPKEYVGYYMSQNLPSLQQQQQPQQQQFQNFTVPQIPSFTELVNRRAKTPQELQPLNINGHRHLSRSPSPLGHIRTYSTPLRSAPLPTSPNAGYPRNDSVVPSEYPRQPGGLLIVNGSGSSHPHSGHPEPPFGTSDDLSGLSIPPPGLGTPFEDAGLKNPLDDALTAVQGPGEFYDDLGLESGAGPYTQEPNGPTNEAASTDIDAQGSNKDSLAQPSPPFIAPTVPPPAQYSTDADDAAASPIPAAPPPWNAPVAAKPPRPPIDTSSAAAASSKQSEPKTAPPRAGPLLSPVMETRTPSPTVQRRPDFGHKPSLNGTGPANGPSGRENVQVNGKSALSRSNNETVPPTPAPPMEKALSQSSADSDKPGSRTATSSAAGPAQPKAGQWETKTNKKKKSGKNKKKSGASQSKAISEQGGQPMPANEADRKGG